MIRIDFEQEVFWGFTFQDITIVWLWAFICPLLFTLLRFIDWPKGKREQFDEYVLVLINAIFIVGIGWDVLLLSDTDSLIDINRPKEVYFMSIAAVSESTIE